MKDKFIYVRQCVGLMGNNSDSQEIHITCETFEGETINLVFMPDDWIDTFTPTIFNHVKKEYIKYLEKKE